MSSKALNKKFAVCSDVAQHIISKEEKYENKIIKISNSCVTVLHSENSIVKIVIYLSVSKEK